MQFERHPSRNPNTVVDHTGERHGNVVTSRGRGMNSGTGAMDAGAVRVLLIEDEDAIAVPLAEGLSGEHFAVTIARNGTDGLAIATNADVILLDLGLPDIDGADVCRILRERTPVPIIVLTARSDEADRVHLLELGADDYLVKPFGLRELVARIGAVLRRSRSATPDTPTNRATVQTLGPLQINRRSRRVTVHGESVNLAPKEFDLLARLADDPGAAVSREQIITSVWPDNWWGPTKTLDVHVASLRKKLGGASLITTIRAVGYRLDT